jgi:hypothetical protein
METTTARQTFFNRIENWKATKTNKLLRYFSDVDFRNGHEGLKNIAATYKVDVSKLEVGEYVIFVNRSKTSLKMFAPNNVIAHLKMPGNARINLKCIQSLPTFFNGQSLDYTSALKKVIMDDLDSSTQKKYNG